MSKKRQLEEESEESSNLDILDAYIEASEMYLEVLKLSDDTESSTAYIVGMTAVYFGKAFLAFSSTDNTEAVKGSLKETIGAYTKAVIFCEERNVGKPFVYTSRLILNTLREELQSL